MSTNWGRNVRETHRMQMFRCVFLKSAVRLAHVQLTTEGAADDVDQVTGQAIKVRAHRNLARRSSAGSGVEDVGAAIIVYFRQNKQ
jgi:hypothetical protein